MSTPKYKHFSFEDRCVIEEFLNHDFNFTQIANRLGKNKTAISKEVLKHRFLRGTASKERPCCFESKPPYVCNSCDNFNHCKKQKYSYNAHIAYNEYKQTLISERAHLNITKEQITNINDVIAPLMIYKNHSVNQVAINHPEVLDISKSTLYRYINSGAVNIKNIDLRRKASLKYKEEKESRVKRDPIIKLGRTYRDFSAYINKHPEANIVEMDTVIGTSGGKGGKCFLTLLFRKSKIMLIYLLPYKRSEYVTEAFFNIKKAIGIDNFQKYFEVILTDNGPEFFDPVSIEFNLITGEKYSNIFYCDANCSWQKGMLERNHEYIRYVLPKGTSFANLTQENCFTLASHINSIPRDSLNKNPLVQLVVFRKHL